MVQSEAERVEEARSEAERELALLRHCPVLTARWVTDEEHGARVVLLNLTEAPALLVQAYINTRAEARHRLEIPHSELYVGGHEALPIATFDAPVRATVVLTYQPIYCINAGFYGGTWAFPANSGPSSVAHHKITLSPGGPSPEAPE